MKFVDIRYIKMYNIIVIENGHTSFTKVKYLCMSMIRRKEMNELIKAIEAENLKSEVPAFGPGDTVKVHVKIIEGKRERVQVFEGVVLKRQGGGVRETFTVRKISFGVGVERTFPIHSPKIEKIEVTRFGKVRRAKITYLRGRVGKAAKIKEAKGRR